jgi:hypothetical protein
LDTFTGGATSSYAQELENQKKQLRMGKQTSSGGGKANGGFGAITSNETAKAAMASLREETPLAQNKHEAMIHKFEDKQMYKNEFPGLGLAQSKK